MSRPIPPAYKTRNWPACNEALEPRGSLTAWFDFEARPGKYWMHRHVPTQEMQLLTALLIVRLQEDLATTGRGS